MSTTAGRKCDFFVVPGTGQALLGMPDIETLYVLTVNCNTTDTQTQNEQIYSKVEDEWHCTNKMLETGRPDKCDVNKNTNNIQNSNNKDNPTFIDNNKSKINHFIPGPQQETEKKEQVQKSHKNYIKNSTMY